MPMRRPGEDVGRRRRDHDLPEELEVIEPQHLRDVAVVLRDVADADRGVDDDRPDRGDEDHEDRRRLAVAEGGERERQPGERRHRAQHLEDRIEPAHRPDRLADQRAERDADEARRAHSRARRAAGWPSRCQNRPCLRPPRSKNGSTISSQVSLTRPSTAAAASRPACGTAAPRPASTSAIMTSGGTTRAAISPSMRHAAGRCDEARLRRRKRQHLARSRGRQRRRGFGLEHRHVHSCGSPCEVRRAARGQAARRAQTSTRLIDRLLR